MRAIWKGAISFGLVTIPVQILNATKRDQLKFRMLRKKDLSPIHYKRVAEVDEKEVPWEEIVKGYEFEKGRFVVMEDKDFEKAQLEGTDSIEIVDFVDVSQVDPIYFYKPYYIEPVKGGATAYALLRDVLKDTGKIGIAKVVIRSRQHLAAVKPKDDLLVLELMHFASEIQSAEGLKVPATKQVDKRTLDMARTLVTQMSSDWEPDRYKDEYATAIMELIQKKIEAGGKEIPGAPKKHAPTATNVIDLVSVLEQSLNAAGGGGGGGSAKSSSRVKQRAPAGGKRTARKSTSKRRGAHRRAA